MWQSERWAIGIMIFIWLLSSVPPLFPRLAEPLTSQCAPSPHITFLQPKGQKRAIRVREMQKVKKVEVVTQKVRDLGQQQQQKWVCFWGLWRPGSQGRISATVTAAAICITLILNKVNLQYISFVKKAFLYCCWIRIKCKRLFNQQHCSSRRESSSASLWRLQQLLLWSWNQVGPATSCLAA